MRGGAHISILLSWFVPPSPALLVPTSQASMSESLLLPAKSFISTIFLMLEKTLECPLDFKEIEPVNPKRNQPWIFTRSESCSVVSDSLWPHGLYGPWNSPGQDTGVGSFSLLQGIFLTQGWNPGLLHCRQILYHLNHKGSPRILEWVAYPFSSGSSQPRNRTGVKTDAKVEAPILWSPDGKSRFIGKDPDAGKDWRQEEKGAAEDEMVGCPPTIGWVGHHRLRWSWVWAHFGRLEDRGALHAAVPGVAKSQIRLKRLNNNNNMHALVYDACFSLSDLLYSS